MHFGHFVKSCGKMELRQHSYEELVMNYYHSCLTYYNKIITRDHKPPSSTNRPSWGRRVWWTSPPAPSPCTLRPCLPSAGRTPSGGWIAPWRRRPSRGTWGSPRTPGRRTMPRWSGFCQENAEGRRDRRCAIEKSRLSQKCKKNVTIAKVTKTCSQRWCVRPFWCVTFHYRY